MMLEWKSGLDNYRNHTLEFGPENTFTLELNDNHQIFNNIEECFVAQLQGATYPIEILYSGGLDSEFVVAVCRKLNLPVVVVTLRLMAFGAPINIHDLYYAEKFCRTYGIDQKLVDIDLEKFFLNGDHIPYLEPYKITSVAAATIMYLIDQCHSFPVFGGDYSWPLTNIGVSAYSPHRHSFNCYGHYMSTKGGGIGNMLSDSNYLNKILIQEHLKVFDDFVFKHHIFKNLGYNLEPRHRSHGWELILDLKLKFDIVPITNDLITRYGVTKSIIKWNDSMGKLIGSTSGEYFDYNR